MHKLSAFSCNNSTTSNPVTQKVGKAMKDRSGLSTIMHVLCYGGLATAIAITLVMTINGKRITVQWYDPFSWFLGPLTSVGLVPVMIGTGLALITSIIIVVRYWRGRRSAA